MTIRYNVFMLQLTFLHPDSTNVVLLHRYARDNW